MSVARSLLLSAALIGMLAAGLWIGGHPANMPPVLRDVFVDDTGGLTVEASELIERYYYESVTDEELTNGSLQGMVRGLRLKHKDRFSEYFSPSTLQEFTDSIEGRFSGIGISVTSVKRGLRAERVFKDSPAEMAGIETGDIITSVGGRSIEGMSTEAATLKIKGPEGTDVVIGVLSPGRKVRELRLTRARIRLPVVSSKVATVDGEKVGYVRLAAFSEGAHGPLRHAVRKVDREGAGSLVLDLRANGGGLLEEAVLSASIFLPEGEVVVTTDSRSEGHAVYETQGDNLPERPIVVLIDGNTASAAEILTAALADNAQADVVGSRSFGKGVFQQEIELSNGGALKLTVGEYSTPEGVSLAGKGVNPNVPVDDLPATGRDEALERALGIAASQQGPE
jgi:carboxyl-terminal processing protease